MSAAEADSAVIRTHPYRLGRSTQTDVYGVCVAPPRSKIFELFDLNDEVRMSTVESNVSQLLRSNEAPSVGQRALLANLATDIDRQILEHERVIACLLAKRERYALLNSAIRQMPNEIILEIASYLLYSKGDSRILLPLSQTCRRWRSALVCVPSLWTHLVVRRRHYEDWLRATMEFVKLCLFRSRDLPLSLSIVGRGKYTETIWEKVLAIAPGRAWREVSITTNDMTHIACCLNALCEAPQSLSSLTKLALIERRPEVHSSLSQPLDLHRFGDLRELVLDFKEGISAARATIYPGGRIPYSQLTKLTLASSLTSPMYLAILSECKNLEECTIGSRNWSVLLDEPLPDDGTNVDLPIHLSHLKRLTIATAGDCPSIISPQHFHFPLLEEFHVSFPTFGSTAVLEAVIKFVSHHSSTLQRLSIPGIVQNYHLWTYETLVKVEELRLTSPHNEEQATRGSPDRDSPTETFRNRFEEVFSPFLTGQGLLPHLKTLELIDHPTFLNGPVQEFWAAVEKRPALRCIRVSPGGLEMWHRMRALQRRAMLTEVEESEDEFEREDSACGFDSDSDVSELTDP